jgi:hypothetical protein
LAPNATGNTANISAQLLEEVMKGLPPYTGMPHRLLVTLSATACRGRNPLLQATVGLVPQRAMAPCT